MSLRLALAEHMAYKKSKLLWCRIVSIVSQEKVTMMVTREARTYRIRSKSEERRFSENRHDLLLYYARVPAGFQHEAISKHQVQPMTPRDNFGMRNVLSLSKNV